MQPHLGPVSPKSRYLAELGCTCRAASSASCHSSSRSRSWPGWASRRGMPARRAPSARSAARPPRPSAPAPAARARSRWRRVKQRRRGPPAGSAPTTGSSPATASGTCPSPRAPTLDPSSQRRVDALADFIDSQARRPSSEGGGYPNINADAFSTPIYRVARGTDAGERRPCPPSYKSPTLRRILAAGVPIPPGRQPGRGKRRSHDRLPALLGHALGVLARAQDGERVAGGLGRRDAQGLTQPPATTTRPRG